MRRENDDGVQLTQGLQPVTQVFAEQLVPQINPRLVENNECRTPIQLFLNSPEQVQQHRNCVFAIAIAVLHEVVHLEYHHAAVPQPGLFRIEQPAERAAQCVDFEGGPNILVLHRR